MKNNQAFKTIIFLIPAISFILFMSFSPTDKTEEKKENLFNY